MPVPLASHDFYAQHSPFGAFASFTLGRYGKRGGFGLELAGPAEQDVYIEYWGLDTPQYKMSMYKKQLLYQQEGKRLVSVFPHDLPSLDTLLSAKLRLFGYTISANERSEVSALRIPSP